MCGNWTRIILLEATDLRQIVGGSAKSLGTIIAAETVGGFGTGVIFVAVSHAYTIND